MQPAVLLIGLAVVWNGLLIAWVLRYYDPDEFAASPEQRILGDEYDEHYETSAAPSADD